MAEALKIKNSAERSANEDLVISRTFDASREQVWKAWTDPEQIRKWWGPKNFTAPHITLDLRVGGRSLFCMRGAGPDGVVRDFWSTGIYKEIVPMERLVTTDSFADEKGTVVPASYYGMDADFPLELLVTVTFEADKAGTRMTLRHAGIPRGEMRELTAAGWNESFDKLAEALAQAGFQRAA